MFSYVVSICSKLILLGDALLSRAPALLRRPDMVVLRRWMCPCPSIRFSGDVSVKQMRRSLALRLGVWMFL